MKMFDHCKSMLYNMISWFIGTLYGFQIDRKVRKVLKNILMIKFTKCIVIHTQTVIITTEAIAAHRYIEVGDMPTT